MYWKDYYEMTEEQTRLTEEIYNRRINTDGRLVLAIDEIGGIHSGIRKVVRET